MSSSVGCRSGLDLVWLWLWPWPTTAALIQHSLGISICRGYNPKKKKKKKRVYNLNSPIYYLFQCLQSHHMQSYNNPLHFLCNFILTWVFLILTTFIEYLLCSRLCRYGKTALNVFSFIYNEDKSLIYPKDKMLQFIFLVWCYIYIWITQV